MTSVAYALEADQATTVVNNGITTAMIQDGAIDSATIAPGAVTGTAIADGTVTSSKIVGGPGSGLNAHLLDGFHSTSLASVANHHDARYSSLVHGYSSTYYDKAYVDALEARIAAL
jgi:hypothetical protein